MYYSASTTGIYTSEQAKGIEIGMEEVVNKNHLSHAFNFNA